jgi:hypothetical protein
MRRYTLDEGIAASQMNDGWGIRAAVSAVRQWPYERKGRNAAILSLKGRKVVSFLENIFILDTQAHC